VLVARGLRSVSPQEAGTLTLIEPLLNPVWAYLISGEVPSPWTLVGGGFILGALAWRYWPRRPAVPAVTESPAGTVPAARRRASPGGWTAPRRASPPARRLRCRPPPPALHSSPPRQSGSQTPPFSAATTPGRAAPPCSESRPDSASTSGSPRPARRRSPRPGQRTRRRSPRSAV